MPQSTAELVKDLIKHLDRFTGLCENFSPPLSGLDFVFSVSLSYSRLRFTIHQSDALYFQYTVHPEAHATPECYCRDQEKIEMLKKHFEPLTNGGNGTFSTSSSQVPYTRTLDNYLTIAESIASCALNCAAGDDYRPGYFSEITVRPEGITLLQINHMNSKSLDHKNNYSLRDLRFFIPSKQSVRQKPLLMDEDYIGTMRIGFTDRSSQNNKRCGDQILRKIEEEKSKFGKSHL